MTCLNLTSFLGHPVSPRYISSLDRPSHHLVQLQTIHYGIRTIMARCTLVARYPMLYSSLTMNTVGEDAGRSNGHAWHSRGAQGDV